MRMEETNNRKSNRKNNRNNNRKNNREKYAELTGPLIPASVDEAANLIIEYFTGRLDRKQITRVRLSIEESMALWCNNAGPDDCFVMTIREKWNGFELRIRADGESMDPYSVKANNEVSGLDNRLLVELGLMPEYVRRNDKNELIFRLKHKPMNPILKIVLVVFGAILLGMIMLNLLPTEFVKSFDEGFLSPIYEAFFRLLGGVAGPMIFLSVAWGIYGIGDAVTLGRIGKKMFILFMAVNTAVALLMLAIYPLLGPGITPDSSGNGGLSAIFSMLLNIIPASVVEPFAEGNTLQIIFLAIIVGTAMVFLGRRTESVAKAIEQVNYLVQYLMRFIADMVPMMTFIVMLRMILNGTISVITGSWKLLACAVPAMFVAMILVANWCGYVLERNPIALLKKSLPLFLITFTTASSAAGFETNSKITKEEMGVESSLAEFGVPLGMVLCRIGVSVYYPLLCFHYANVYDVSVSWQILVAIMIATVFIGVATPPIPGGAAASFVALFTQVGIPTEAVAAALALNVILDFFMTAACQTPIPMLLAVLGKKTDRLK